MAWRYCLLGVKVPSDSEPVGTVLRTKVVGEVKHPNIHICAACGVWPYRVNPMVIDSRSAHTKAFTRLVTL